MYGVSFLVWFVLRKAEVVWFNKRQQNIFFFFVIETTEYKWGGNDEEPKDQVKYLSTVVTLGCQYLIYVTFCYLFLSKLYIERLLLPLWKTLF